MLVPAWITVFKWLVESVWEAGSEGGRCLGSTEFPVLLVLEGNMRRLALPPHHHFASFPSLGVKKMQIPEL